MKIRFTICPSTPRTRIRRALFAAVFALSVAVVQSASAQILDRKITISLRGISLDMMLKEIEQAAGIHFAYSADQLDLSEVVSLDVRQQPLRLVLAELFNPRKISYAVHEKRAIITLKKQVSGSPAPSPNDTSPGLGSSSVKRVSGTVTDGSTLQPMAGVNVLVKGTTRGTTTDSDGRFSVEASESDRLVFSFIGYAAAEVPVAGQSVIDVILDEDVKSLDEVVINAGYYGISRRQKTGSIVKVESREIRQQPVSNPIAALQGRVPGLDIIQQSGLPGGNFTIRIRGQNSIAAGNEPLFIIDGVPFTSTTMAVNETSGSLYMLGTSPLNALNPADIESIEVLKDADATAIYGSRGANGVILITTKKAAAGPLKVNMTFYSGAGKAIDNIRLLNTQQYLDMRREAYANDQQPPGPFDAPDLLVWDTTRYTDWKKELTGGTAPTTDAQLTFSGGDVHTQYHIGAGYHREGTVFPGDQSDRRIASHVSIASATPDARFRINFSGNYSVNDTDLIKHDLTGTALILSPNAPPVYTPTGDLNWENSTWENPFSYLKQNYAARTSNLIGNLSLLYSLLPALDAKVSVGYTEIAMDAITTTPVSSYNPAEAIYRQNMSVFATSGFRNWIVEPQLNWHPTLKSGSLDILLGGTFLNQETESRAISATGFVSEQMMKNVRAATNLLATSATATTYRYAAVFGRLNYAFREKYIINLTGRRDGSSRFGPDKQFAWFGAVGTAWLFSNENLFKNALPFLSFGKLRASYGLTGNDQIGDYSFLDTYAATGPYQEVSGLVPARLYNADFGWETNKKLEAAIEAGFAENRITIEAAYYRNESSNQLVGYNLPPTAGFSTIQNNLPATIRNTGLEVTVSTINLESADFRWSTSFNITFPKNELVSYPDLENSSYANQYVIGKSLQVRKLYTTAGVDPQTGVYRIVDANEDGILTQQDRQSIIDVSRKYYGGLHNSIRYKGFELDFLFQFAKQDGNNYLYAGWPLPPGWLSNQPDYVVSRWQREGDLKRVQQFTATYTSAADAYFYLYASDQSVGDASFIRLKNVSLSYTLPVAVITRFHLSQLRLFVQGQNLLTFTHYEGLDPETQTNALPPLRTLVGGLQVTL